MEIGIVDYVDGSPDLFNVQFQGDIIRTLVTHEPREVVDWISEVEAVHRRRLNHLIVGLDAEWRPSFSKGHQNPVATLQLCVGRRCLVFQILHCSYIPDRLVGFLANPSYTFVGVAIKGDVEKLVEDYNLWVRKAVDLRALAVRRSNDLALRNVGLKDLVRIYMGAQMEKPKRVTMGRWDQEFLTTEQIQYACIDAFVCFEIGRILNASFA
ncbi:Werner Syndrome-like exonuclease [Ipomoea triloba]|uniref:Werner Syndrome-like exonuclease n=1 Tax=Ipomoea triloba TaxID=35885 RepID=UPI00125E3774|nr:Werner Syndrome-like exonuclease [Ipomoea triloba]